MIKKTLILLFALFLAYAGKSFSQEIKPISTIEEMQQIKDTNKDKVMLINFWATWCKPCVKEFPELVKLYNNYKDKGFELIFISVDVPEDIESKVIPFLKKQGVDFVSYYNKFDKPEELINYIDKNWEGAIPSTYIYDKEGNLTTHILGSKSYEEFEKEITKNLD
jgi:thiol-disulfide isomerase/thioredoxin